MGARNPGSYVALVLFCATLGAATPERAEAQVFTWVNTGTVVFPTPGVAQFDAGEVQATQVVTMLVWPFGGGTWRLNIRTDDLEMGNGKPITDVLWRRQGAGGWTPLTNANQPVTAVQNGLGIVRIEFKLKLAWATDGPGSYQSDVVLEVTP